MMSYNELLSENKQLKELNNSLQFQLNELKKLIFGSKSERFISTDIPNQLNLFSEFISTEAPQVKTEKISYERKKAKKHPGRHPLPEHLPVEENIIYPDGYTTDMKIIGKDVTDTLKYDPASLVILRTIRIKCLQIVTDQEDIIIQAPMPTRPIEKCIAEASLLSYILVCKFIDHLPFYRQIQRFNRDYNWILSKSTINDWFIAVCTLLDPLYKTMVGRALESQYLQADESHIRVQDGDKKGVSHMGWQWLYYAPIEKIVLFNYRKGRGVDGPKEFLENYTGWLQCDGYPVYDKIGKRSGINLVGCHVHARRYFVKAKDQGDNRAEYILKIYQEIYRYENICKDYNAKDRQSYRLNYIAPLMSQLKEWLDEQALVVLPKSPLGKAMSYTIKQWPKLKAVLQDGRLELDNNLIENKIRPLALGRKNYMFAGSHQAAQRIAMMYTFFATCKANNVNPYQWLKHVLEIIPDYKVKDLDQLIPGNNTMTHE